MKGSTEFTQAIKNFLENYCKQDSLFIPKYKNEKKNINDCVTYIINQVRKSGNNAFEQNEIFQMAIHYYDEENIKVGKRPNGRVVSPATGEPQPKMKVVKKKEVTKTKPIENPTGQLQMF